MSGVDRLKKSLRLAGTTASLTSGLPRRDTCTYPPESAVWSLESVMLVVGVALVSAKTRFFMRLVVDQTPMTGLALASLPAARAAFGSSSATVLTL